MAHLGYGARTMEIDVWVQVLLVKLIHPCGVFCVDVAVADVLAYDGSIFGFHQTVVAGVMRPRLGLFDE